MDYYNVAPTFRALSMGDMKAKVMAKSTKIFDKLDSGDVYPKVQDVVVGHLEESSIKDTKLILIDKITEELKNTKDRLDNGTIYAQDHRTTCETLELLRKNKTVYLDAQFESHGFVLKLIKDRQYNIIPNATASMRAEKVIFHRKNAAALKGVTHLGKKLSSLIESYQTMPSTPKMVPTTAGLSVPKN